ncbi:MAG: nucleotide sugar dehydrogenase [Holosporales bacterium]|jgi:UDPglucose 6-dehydrogenase|nr:nucleotide sugar dehydrogenase [Holosporales bacterium]
MLKITIVGGGYIGVVSGVCFCEFGFLVNIVETDTEKLQDLKNNLVSVYEPSLESGLKKHQEAGTLKCFDNLSKTHHEPDVIVIAIAYSEEEGQRAEIHDVIRDVALLLSRSHYTAILIKTTTSVGTCSIIKKNVQFLRPDLILSEHYDIIVNPDFLREGYALHDFVNPDILVIGVDQNSKKARDLVAILYSMIISSGVQVIWTNQETAELTKYARTAFIVAKIAIMNEFADLCGKSGADIDHLTMGVSLDSYVGLKLLKVTPGFGGLSYLMLTRGVIRKASTLGMECRIMQAVMDSNADRIKNISTRIINKLSSDNGPNNKKLAVLGVACKPQTNDVYGAPSISVIHTMLENDVLVSAYDPSLCPDVPRTLKQIPEKIRNDSKFQLASSVYEAVTQSDMIVVMADWAEFLTIDFGKIWELMNRKQDVNPIIMDTYNLYTKTKTRLKNFEYISAEEILG